MFRVLHIYKTHYPESRGGVEEMIHQLITHSDAAHFRHEVLVIGTGPTACDDALGYRVHRCKQLFSFASTPVSWQAIMRLRSLISGFDILHYHFPFPFGDCMHFMAAGFKKPTVVTYHSDIVRQRFLSLLYAPLRHVFLRSCDQIVATSPQYTATSTILQHWRKKVAVVPLGLPQATSDPLDITKMRASVLDLPVPFFLFIGVLRYYKGLDFLLEALQRVSCSMVIAGDGPEMERLQAMAQRLKLKRVVFLGQVNEQEKQFLLRRCRAFVFPSRLRSEAYGLSLVEAAMHGCPMITCEIGTGTSFINQHGVTGLVVPPRDAEALAQALAQVAGHSDKQIEQWQRASRQRFQDYLEVARMVSSYQVIYKTLCS